ncbi:MAG: hypothetical protein Q7U32_02985 [Rhodocyclaceae bacterium]|nr:hypothetical protein [Rhodocyclaceae bacterium]
MNKKDLVMLLEQPIAFHPVLARVAGSATAGLFLSQLFYWTGRGQIKDDWIYKDWQEWNEETCLTQDEQRGARRLLEKKGLIEVSSMRALKIDKFKPTLCFRINFDQLKESIQHLNWPENPTVEGDGNFPSRGGNSPQGRAENPTPEDRNSHPGGPKFPLLYTETTPETTSETTTTSAKLPELWLEAVEVEIENEEKRRPVLSPDGFRKKVLERYWLEGGPGPGVLKQLGARKRAQERRAQPPTPEPARAAPGVVSAHMKGINRLYRPTATAAA